MGRIRGSTISACFVLLALACGQEDPAQDSQTSGGPSASSAGTLASTGASDTTTGGSVGTSGAGVGGGTATSGVSGSTGAVGTTDGANVTGSTDGAAVTGSTGAAATNGVGGMGATGTDGSATSTTGGMVDLPELVTSGPGAYWVEGSLTEGGGNASVSVDEGTTYQTWRGFGGTFNEKGWDALSVLDASERDRAIQLLFSEAEGAGFDWGRLPIGASDYAMSRYTLAETPDDYDMQSFSIERDRQMLIPYIKAALAVKPDVHLWASPWSPPAWMKDSNNIDGTDEYDNSPATFTSHMLSDPQILQAYALYFAKFVEEYQKEGITIAQVMPQNEPGYATRYPSCLWDAGLLGTFVGSYLGPTLADHGLSTEIWFGTLSNSDTYSGQIGGLTGDAASYVQGVGLQWNTISNTGTLSGQGYGVMQTEHKCGNYPWESATWNPNQPPNDQAYAEESWGLIKQWLEAGVHIYSAWNMVLDSEGKNIDVQRPWPQNALLTVDRSSKTLNATPAYYVFRHLSQFVAPGAVRLGTSGGDAVAFKNPDESIVTVLFNSGGQDTNTTLAVAGTTLQFSIPAHGWATVNWKG